MKNGNTEAKRNRAREKERKSVKVYIANNIDERAEKYRSSIILPWLLPRLFPDRFLPFFVFDMRPRRYDGKTYGFEIKHIVVPVAKNRHATNR